jgi:2,4-dienoyl-CoA reductase-like NADH-dependent reductase (Old Yellow Enzyme family)
VTKFIEPLGRLVKFIKQQNATAGIQFGHSGRKARATRPWEGDKPLERMPEIEELLASSNHEAGGVCCVRDRLLPLPSFLDGAR